MYTDPGSGLFMIQMLTGIALASAYGLRRSLAGLFWRRPRHQSGPAESGGDRDGRAAPDRVQRAD